MDKKAKIIITGTYRKAGINSIAVFILLALLGREINSVQTVVWGWAVYCALGIILFWLLFNDTHLFQHSVKCSNCKAELLASMESFTENKQKFLFCPQCGSELEEDKP